MHEFNCAAILEFSYFNLVSVLTNKIDLYNTLGRFNVLKREITNARIFYYFTRSSEVLFDVGKYN